MILVLYDTFENKLWMEHAFNAIHLVHEEKLMGDIWLTVSLI